MANDLEGVDDLEVEDVVDADEERPTYDLLSYPADFTLEVLHQKLSVNKDIEIPHFQRKFVWTLAQASRLIESFLMGLPVPPVFLYAERKSDKLLVVDGQQRLRAISYFFSGLFGEETEGKRSVFRLKLEPPNKWGGLSMNDLAPEDAARLKNSVLRSYVMKQLNPEDQKSIFYVFERLNSGGTLLRAQEVRHSIYGGPFNNLLHELNLEQPWRKILGRGSPDSRLKDVELVLRALALTFNLDNYDKPMSDFLSNFMVAYRSKPLPQFKETFTEAASAIVEHLGAKPFHIKAGLNAAVFDAVFVAFSQVKGPIPEDIKSRYETLKSDTAFRDATQKATSDSERVKARINIARVTLFGK